MQGRLSALPNVDNTYHVNAQQTISKVTTALVWNDQYELLRSGDIEAAAKGRMWLHVEVSDTSYMLGVCELTMYN